VGESGFRLMMADSETEVRNQNQINDSPGREVVTHEQKMGVRSSRIAEHCGVSSVSTVLRWIRFSP